MRRFAYLLILNALSAPPLLASGAQGGAGMAVVADPSTGFLTVPEGLASASPETPCYLLLPVGRGEMEDPSRLEPVLEETRSRGLRPVVRLLDEEWQSLSDWTDRITSFAARMGDRVDAYQLFGPGAARIPARDYAFLLKNARVAVRAAGSWALIAGAPIAAGDTAWAEALFNEDAAPYLDIVAAVDPEALDSVMALRDRRHGRVPIWITDAPAGDGIEAAIDTFLEARAAGAETILFVPSTMPGLGSSLSRLRGLFTPGFGAAAAGALPFDPAGAVRGGGSGPQSLEMSVLPFFDSETRDGIAAYRPAPNPSGSDPPGAVRFTLRSPIESLDLVSPVTGETRVISGPAAAGAVAELPVRPSYLLLRYRLAATAIPVKESSRVGAHSELTAEEVIAREREVRGVQERRLQHYEAKATIDIHYRVASLNESVDVSTENLMFVKDGQQDYAQTALYVNGALWRGKSPPYLPYLQPGTVGEVPLDISLDERYRYTLEGREKTEGRECYVLSFEPTTEKSESLYRGRVFIDAKLFTRVRMEAVQTGLIEPVRSSEVVFRYGPVPAPGGEAWLPIKMTGQMTFEVLGNNLVVERHASYTDYVANQEGFEERRAAAYESNRPILRDTGGGLSRVEVTDGQEELRSIDSPRNTLLVFGISVGEEGLPSFPFAGVNFFDFNFKDTGTQFNLAWAGPFADLSWNQPDLFGVMAGTRPLALTLQGTFSALELEERNATATGTPRADRIDVLRESVRAGLSIPMGEFFKWTLETRFLFQNFDRSDDTDPAFVLPVTNLEGGLGLRLEFARLGWLLSASGEASRRSKWESWGLPGQRFSDDDRDFTRLTVGFRKAFYIGTYNKLGFGVTGFDGRSLDRFSRFELGDFRSARVRGFNGSGIHFDRGLVAEASYAFPLGRSLRADLGVQQGIILSEDDFGPDYERVLGSGLSLEFSGPWSTFVTVRVSRALSSTLEDLGSGGDLRVVFFRTFDKWSRKGGRGTSPGPRHPVIPEAPTPPIPPE